MIKSEANDAMENNEGADCAPARQSKTVIVRRVVSASSGEAVSRYGDAGAEYIVAYSGVNNQTGQRFSKSHRRIAGHKLNPKFCEQNIKQQAGFSAEVAATTKENAEAIIKKSKVRSARSDDLVQYGKNHQIVDRVKLVGGNIVPGSELQTKFVKNREDLFKKIAEPGGKFEKYQGVVIELPTEQATGDASAALKYRKMADAQRELARKADKIGLGAEAEKHISAASKYETMALECEMPAEAFCKYKAEQFRKNADMAAAEGRLEAAEKLRCTAEKLEQIKVKDAGYTTRAAIFYRKYPRLKTAMEMAGVGHQAGVEGAKIGFAVGGTVALVTNAFLVSKGHKAADEAIMDTVKGMGTGALAGYAASATGSLIKSSLQQSTSSTLRALAKGNVVSASVDICFSLSGSVKRFVEGDVDEAEFLEEIGKNGATIIAAGMMSVVGQVAIPIPVLGAAIGSFVGTLLSGMFYQHAVDAAKDKRLSQEELVVVRRLQEAAREQLDVEAQKFQEQFAAYFDFLDKEVGLLMFSMSNSEAGDSAELATSINRFARVFGCELSLDTKSDLDRLIVSGKPLRL